MTAQMHPIITINGTSREELVAQRRLVLEAVEPLRDALRRCAPNARDYPGDTHALRRDRGIHYARLAAVEEIHAEVLAEAVAIQRETPLP
jgi:hypothetical protein